MRPSLAALLSLASLVSMSGAKAPLSAQSQRPGARAMFGVNVPDIAIGRRLSRAAHAFIEQHSPLLRVPIYWSQVETTPRRYTLPAQYRALLQVAANNQSKLVVVLGYNNPLYDPECLAVPRYHRGGVCITGVRQDADHAGFVGYARYLAHELGDRVAVWEVWNEENAPAFWQPRPDVRAYLSLLSDAAATIHEAVPGSVVISGGTAGVDLDFVTALLASPAAAAIDGIGVHMNAVRPDTIPARLGGRPVLLPLPAILAHLDALYSTYGKRFYVTEFGYPLFSNAYDSLPAVASLHDVLRSEHQRALLTTYDAISQDPAIAAAIVFRLQDDLQRLNPLGGIRGLIDFYGNLKPAARLFPTP